jgi:hypothetical protein
MLDDVERRRLLVQPARERPSPAFVRPLNVELDERAGEPLGLPRGGRLAGAKPDDRILHPDRLAGLHRQVTDDPVALVEQAQHRDPLGHRRDPLSRIGRRALLLRLRAALLPGGLLGFTRGERQRGCQGRSGAHAYFGVQA